MAVAAWTINIRLISSGNVGRNFSRLGAQTDQLNRKASNLNQTLSNLKTVGLAGLVAGGVLAGDALLSGAKGATAFQTAILKTSVSTAQMGKNLAQTMSNMRPFSDLALKISLNTAQSLSTSMDMVAAASKVFKNPQQLHAVMPTLAQFADAQYLQNGTNPSSAIADAGRVAHMFGAYNPKDTHPVMEAWWKVLNSAPDTAPTLTTQLGYFAELFNRVKVSPLSTMNFGVLGDVAVGHGKWGAGFGRMLLDLANPTKEKMAGQYALGLRNSATGALNSNVLDANGAFDPMKMNAYLAHRLEGMSGMQAMSALAGAFNTTAVRVLALTTSSKNLKFIDSVLATQKKMPTYESAQAQFMGTLNGQLQLFTSNLQTLNTEIFMPLVPTLTSLVHQFAMLSGNLAVYMHHHPEAAKAAAIGLLGVTAAGGAAALAIGGHYIAHAAPWLFKRGAGRLALGAVATGLATRGGVRGIAGAAGRWGLDMVTGRSAVRAIGNTKSWGFLRSIIPAIRDVSYVFRELGAKALVTRTGMALIGETLLKLGLRAIPVVGEILMLIDTIKFLGNHSFSIGKLIGEGAHLIWDGLNAAWGFIVSFFKNLWNFITHPNLWISGAGSIVGWFRNAGGNLAKGVQAGWNATDSHPPKSKVAHMASGGFTRGDGLAYLHKNEMVVSAPLTKRLDALTRNVDRSRSGYGGPLIGNITVNVNGAGQNVRNLPRKIAKEIAYQVAAILGDDMRLPGGGSVIVDGGFSQYELSGGMA